MEIRFLIFPVIILILGSAPFSSGAISGFSGTPPDLYPAGQNIVSPADGTVVYVKQVQPHEKVIAIKKGVAVSVNDITRTDLRLPKLLSEFL